MFFGEPGRWFNDMQMDGDKTTVFHDIDGSVSEYPGAFLVKEDNWLLRHPDCIDVPDWKAAICSGHYAQVGRQTQAHTHCKLQINFLLALVFLFYSQVISEIINKYIVNLLCEMEIIQASYLPESF